ncbi:MAG: acylphosphatase [Methanothrix sp.]|nr:acylphosphatase [Methanothrix sp.]MCR3884589.1 acylphosphatase [Methanothrix sp.]
MEGHFIWVIGDVQKYGYRRRVVAMAKALGIKGLVMTLPDGRVKIMAEGEEADLERFEEALKMKDSFFKVTGVEVKRVDLPVDVDDFYFALNERDDEFWLDVRLKYLKELLDVTREGFDRVVSGIDRGIANDREKEPDAGPDAGQKG